MADADDAPSHAADAAPSRARASAKGVPVPDDLLAPPPSTSSAAELPALERLHVQSVYDEIAEQWHGTRYRAWPRVEEFVRALPPSSLVADLGCGNGKMAAACRAGAHYAVGCDFSAGLVRIAALQQKLDAQVADVMALPYRAGAFDAALSIAVLHHVSSEPRRALLVAETLRVLRPGGVALFYAWAQEQHAGRSGHRFERQDVFVAWHQRDGATGAAGDVLQRYCHVYCEGELRALVAATPGCRVVDEYYDTGNWCVVAEKVGWRRAGTEIVAL